MVEEDRRSHCRLKLHWRVVCSEELSQTDPPDITQCDAWTHDISAGGMYLAMPSAHAPGNGSQLAFRLAVPPGEGYSVCGCTLAASGKVVRQTEQAGDKVWLAVQFSEAPTLSPLE